MKNNPQARPELSFDGFGINYSRDPYSPRLATFSESAKRTACNPLDAGGLSSPETQSEAYGRLFAAAPDLLAALKSFVNRGEIMRDADTPPAVTLLKIAEAARAAIAKATGEGVA